MIDQLPIILCRKLGELPGVPEGNARGLGMIEIAEKYGAARGVTSTTAYGVSKH